MLPVKTPYLIQKLLPDFIWRIADKSKTIYLTFDDGPVPEVTPFVLDQLAQYKAKATFFCIGENVKRHHTIYQRIISEGHSVGNHTYNHLNGWFTRNNSYLKNIDEAHQLINSNLFRPPYGKITLSQAKAIYPQYKIIMWDVLSFDFNSNLTGLDCYTKVISNAKPGSIVVMHDSIKASDRLKIALPLILEYYQKEGFAIKGIV